MIKRYYYAGIDLIPAVEALIEYVADSDLGGNILGDLRRLRERILNENKIMTTTKTHARFDEKLNQIS